MNETMTAQQELIPIENPMLSKLVDETQIDKTKAQKVLDNFVTFFEEASKWEADVQGLVITDVSQVAEMDKARGARLALKNVRVAAEKTKKKLKENVLIEGRFIDGIYNAVVAVTKPLEDDLLEKEKFAERKEQARIDAIRIERETALQEYEVDTSFYDLANMTDAGFVQLLNSTRIAYEQQIEAEKKAEAERIAQEKAEAEERERIIKENEQLRKEAEAKEKALAQERAKAEKERVAREKQAAIEKQKRDEELRKVQAEKDAIIAQEKARQEAELKVKAEREAREAAEKQAQEARERAAQVAPDKTKLTTFCNTILEAPRPSLTTPEAITLLDDCIQTIKGLKAQAEEL